MQVFLHCDMCKKTFQEETELQQHKEYWRGSSWSCASGARDALEHQKSCTENKTNSNVLIAHKRAYPDTENESQNGETNRSKIRRKNNHEGKIITELKEEQDDIDSVIDIKEETIEEEGTEDPLSSDDPSLPGRPVQVDP